MEDEGKGMPIATGGGETKASSSSSSGSSSYSPLSSLEALLADPQGSELFEEYLESEGLLQQLHFLFAVDGLKTIVSSNEPPQKLAQKIKSIAKLLDKLVGLSESTKAQLQEDLTLPSSVNVFDRARDEIEAHMKINLLPNFLKSDIYIFNYVKLQTIMEEGGTGNIGKDEDEQNSKTTEPVATTSAAVRTSSKEKEPPSSSSRYYSQSASNASTSIVKLTSGALEATRRVRLDGAAPSSRGLVIHHHPRKGCGSAPVLNPYHASYSSYNPVSRQDSEIQSLSSADGKLGTVPAFLRKLGDRKSASASSSKTPKQKDNLQKIHPTDVALLMKKEIPKFVQEDFTRELMTKLEIVASTITEDRKKEERRKELEWKSSRKGGGGEELRPHAIASALRKIQCGSQVEAPDDILDQHLSRIWTDKTPIRSPPRHGSSQKVKKSNGSSRKKIDTYSVDSGIEFKTPGYEINPLKKVSRQKPPASTTQEDSGISLISSAFTHAQQRVAEWQANLPKSTSAHHSLHHQQTPMSSSSSGPAPKKPTTPPRFTIFVIYSDGPEPKNNKPYRLSSDETLTLGQLKQKLPHRGNYRYFFKKECPELKMVVQEEITRDDDYLPLFDVGKIFVTLQPLPQPQPL